MKDIIERCGILLCGGKGTRLAPITSSVSKQLLPVYDKPMVYYSLSLLMLAKIKDVAIISDSYSLPMYKKLLGDGSQFGISLSYFLQEEPKGIAQAFTICENFIKNRTVCLVLGDNIFHGAGLSKILKDASNNENEATVFGYWVKDPTAYGVIEFDDRSGRAISIEEKPKEPKSNYAVPGIYFYPNSVVEIAKNLKPSNRGEYEITDINRHYLTSGNLTVKIMQRGIAWLDSGTPDSLNDASNFVRTIQERTGLKIADLKEIAINNNWIR